MHTLVLCPNMISAHDIASKIKEHEVNGIIRERRYSFQCGSRVRMKIILVSPYFCVYNILYFFPKIRALSLPLVSSFIFSSRANAFHSIQLQFLSNAHLYASNAFRCFFLYFFILFETDPDLNVVQLWNLFFC